MPLYAWAYEYGMLNTQIELCAPMLVEYKFMARYNLNLFELPENYSIR